MNHEWTAEDDAMLAVYVALAPSDIDLASCNGLIADIAAEAAPDNIDARARQFYLTCKRVWGVEGTHGAEA